MLQQHRLTIQIQRTVEIWWWECKVFCRRFRNRATGRFYPWTFSIKGSREQYTATGSLVVDNSDAIARATMAGLGLSQMPAFLATQALAQGDLVEVLHTYRPPEIPVWIYYLDRRFVAPRIRAFTDFMLGQRQTFAAMCGLR